MSRTIAPLTHREAMSLQAHELECTLASLRSLDDAAWTAATDCPAWDVRAMYQHVLGACEVGRVHARERPPTAPGPGATARQNGGPLEAALSSVQVRERSDLSPAQIVERLAAIAPKTVRGRARTPALVRTHAKLAVDGPVYETWNSGYLIDTIYLRDLWMHRVDVAHALGRPARAQAPTTMVGSSPTSSPNGRAATASPSCSSSPARPVAAYAHDPRSPRPSAYRSTPSSSVARSLVGHRQPACSPRSSHSENRAGTVSTGELRTADNSTQTSKGLTAKVPTPIRLNRDALH